MKNTAYPFSFAKSFNGKAITSLNSTTDVTQIWKNRVLLVLGTRPGERVMRPDFGCNLYTALFETQSVAEQIINTTITEAFTSWLPDLALKQISPTFDDTTNTFTINILYGLPNAEVDSVTINSGIFNRSGELTQEITNG
ncbi:baseplate wedge subunit [uncultured Caudovirales phage]|uniref:Baseplate wedge subunit n=1 Tax=uncultured Caudovirales phage TaxID=2100421 RepID=A0A6J5L448_9CAUD|nr:baseplate wedge subunit [uncultured Caudovirales phage]